MSDTNIFITEILMLRQEDRLNTSEVHMYIMYVCINTHICTGLFCAITVFTDLHFSSFMSKFWPPMINGTRVMHFASGALFCRGSWHLHAPGAFRNSFC